MRVTLMEVLAAAVLAGLAPRTERPADPPPAAKPADKKSAQAALMGKKLDHAKRLLEGLTLNDLSKAGKSADELMAVSQKAEFAAFKTKEYDLYTNDFRRALETIAKKAKDGNLDGATLGYVNMTLACIRCHQATREIKLGLLPAPAEFTRVGGP